MSWIKRLFRRAKLEREMNEELGYHLDRRIAEMIAESVDAVEARRNVRRARASDSFMLPASRIVCADQRLPRKRCSAHTLTAAAPIFA